MIHIINPLEYPGWDEFVLAHPNATIFHSTNWVKVLKKTYGYEPVYFTLSSNEGVSVFPVMEVNSPVTGLRGVSLPFADYCEPLLYDDSEFEELYREIVEHGRRRNWKYVLFKMIGEHGGWGEPSARYFRHVLTLDGDEGEVLKNFRSSTKRNIKKAEKEGVEARIYRSLDSLREFYRLYCMTRKLVQNLPPYPWKFILSEYEQIISKGLGFVVLASINGRNVAGGIFYNFGGNVLYRYGASDRNYLHLRPNNLVMWEAIKWSIENRYRTFCFGSTDFDNDGLRQFKRGWGTEEISINYYKLDIKEESFKEYYPRAGLVARKVFRKTPMFLLKMAGALLYKHLG